MTTLLICALLFLLKPQFFHFSSKLEFNQWYKRYIKNMYRSLYSLWLSLFFPHPTPTKKKKKRKIKRKHQSPEGYAKPPLSSLAPFISDLSWKQHSTSGVWWYLMIPYSHHNENKPSIQWHWWTILLIGTPRPRCWHIKKICLPMHNIFQGKCILFIKIWWQLGDH